MVGEPAFCFYDLGQRPTLTPRLVNNVECELAGAVLHLQRQRPKSDPAPKTRDRGTPGSTHTPGATHTNPRTARHPSLLQTPEPSAAGFARPSTRGHRQLPAVTHP